MKSIALLLSVLIISGNILAQGEMKSFTPESVSEYAAQDSARIYRGEEIFDYMDGAGEIYRSYNFDKMLVRRYLGPNQQEILLEIFDMDTSRNAYGIFTYMSGSGTNINIGQDGEYRKGLLCFWKGRYFVCVYTETDNIQVSKNVFDLGRHVASSIPAEGPRPEIIKYIPQNKYTPKSLKYFYRHEILNIHYFVEDKNILNINDSTDCAIVLPKHDKSHLLVVRYPSEGQAKMAQDAFIMNRMPDGGAHGIVRTANKKWTACSRKDNYLILLFDGDLKEQSITFLESIKRNIP